MGTYLINIEHTLWIHNFCVVLFRANNDGFSERKLLNNSPNFCPYKGVEIVDFWMLLSTYLQLCLSVVNIYLMAGLLYLCLNVF